ncbi:MAG: glycosyltransferase [Spirochaetota bacterium]|jgi:glycosyltransferase involved in cell wall biosynthesis
MHDPSLNEMSLKTLHITSSIGEQSFGLGHVAVSLAQSQNELGLDAWLWCLDPADQIKWAVAHLGLNDNKVKNFPCKVFSRLGYSHKMFLSVKNEAGCFDVVHQHGIWTACSYMTKKIREKHRIPTVVAPHGSLQKWALKHSSWKKQMAYLAYEGKNLHYASCLHATSDEEISDFRNYGLSNPIALISNGVSPAWLESKGNGEQFRNLYAIRQDKRILLFMSRITPKKGLLILLEAMARIQDRMSDWLLIVAGSDEFGHLKEVAALVHKLNLENLVIFSGPLYGQEKRNAFAAADVFILPSYSEGSPMVVLDALAAGVPVITTQATPWEQLVNLQCGWWTDATIEGLVNALNCAIDSNPIQLRAMGDRGKNLVHTHYLWSLQAEKTKTLYAWLMGNIPKPDFIIVD